MKCTHCNKREANTHIKKTINGKTEEMHLCSECAKELGVMDEFEPLTIDSFFGSFLGNGSSPFALSSVGRCRDCGSTFNDIINSGHVGCANCYDIFEDMLLPSIEKIHGRAKHVGKNVTYTVDEENESVSKDENKQPSIDDLKEDLKKAIKEERFEDAAVLRDKIKDMTEKGDSNE